MAKVPRYLRTVGMGHMRESIAIQAGTPTTATDGEVTNTWATITNGTLRAEKIEERGSESWDAMQIFGTETRVFRVRYKSGITRKHRVLWNSVQHDIVEIVDPGNRHRELLIRCVERKGGAV